MANLAYIKIITMLQAYTVADPEGGATGASPLF